MYKRLYNLGYIGYMVLLALSLLFFKERTIFADWLLSTVEQGATASIIINEDLDRFTWAASHSKVLMTTWGQYVYENLPSRYFKFNDTTSAFRIVR